ncbi:Disease resistance protein RPM1 [Abeliophyllum distichum]|uniref:Disease resistance protein RPM1 n=1 Tax=Abeliophyllum distichum TaxID=126358 RepID=A0ABD1TGJ0_9LAMI
MAESAVSFVVERLTATLWEKLREVGGVGTEVENIRDELDRMAAFLKDADAVADSDTELRTWVSQVRDVAQDTEDVLDKFVFGLTRNHHGNRSITVVFKCFNWIINFRFNYGIASEIKSIKSRVISIAEGRQRYLYKFSNRAGGSSSIVGTNVDLAYDTRGDALLVEEADLVGTESPKRELMGLLVEGGSRLGVISVAGMGGLGKTTLVKKLYGDAAVKKHFQSHAWITVSQLFKIEELLKGIIQQLFQETKQAVPRGMNTMNNYQLKEVIKQFLQERRYVLVFDDVWSIQAWDAIKYALPNNSYGSRVIVTTRLTDVASHCSMGTNENVYMLKPLTTEQSWTLFCEKTFRGSSCPLHLMEISHNILKRCAGLPLAINAVGGFLATKSNRYEDWAMLNQSIGAELESDDITYLGV